MKKLICTQKAEDMISGKGISDQVLKLISEITQKFGGLDYTLDVHEDPESSNTHLKLSIHAVGGEKDPTKAEKTVRAVANKYIEVFRKAKLSFYTFPEGR